MGAQRRGSRWFVGATLAALVAMLVAFARYGGFSPRTSAESQTPQLRLLEEFCSFIRLAMAGDREAFLSDDVSAREAALARFHEGRIIHHNARSVALCLGGPERLPAFPTACWLTKD